MHGPWASPLTRRKVEKVSELAEDTQIHDVYYSFQWGMESLLWNCSHQRKDSSILNIIQRGFVIEGIRKALL